MEKDKHVTKVRFVKPLYPDGQREILAVFMGQHSGLRVDHRGAWVRGCYAHIGQHSECSDGFQRRTRATPEEYAPLMRELESLGYNVKAI